MEEDVYAKNLTILSAGGLSGGAIAGIAIGAVAAIALAALLAFFLIRRRKRKPGPISSYKVCPSSSAVIPY